MMAIVIEKNSETRKLTYAFFDRNYGVIQTDSKYIFTQFLNYIVKIRDDIYKFPGLQNDTVNIFIYEMEHDDIITEYAILPVIDENLVNITTNKILCENRNNFTLDNKVKIIIKQFTDNNRITTIQLISEKNKLKNINIVLDTLSADKILSLFTNQYENILQLSENNIHIRINNENYKIRKITNASDIIYQIAENY
ncbi:hypothetical protein [Arsenophonus endosymbiont of Aleurodicus floccissimus]|uniref:hypothetical protein n=1 Tax=Arsenophonus endosymbiont of Aleurodicus floccissimus TaxID=2152761 RepID=UPI000E6B22F3|nr:hypothetical protein [Arsenophonus endosymbiont of Aleurodicus floccissimus]